MPTLTENLRSRWSPAWDDRPAFADHKATLERALAFAEFPAKKRVEIAAPGTLSPKGVAQTLRFHLKENALGEVRRVQKVVADEEQAIKAARGDLASPKIDKSDILGELQRQEIRTWLRSMEPGARFATLMAAEDPTITEAALSAAPVLSGLNPDRVPHVQKTYVERHHADALAALEEREEVNTLVRVAVEVAVNAIREGSELKGHDFDRWFATGEEPTAEAA